MTPSDHPLDDRLAERLRLGPRLAFVSTYPPTVCGLASFTASLRTAMAEGRGSGDRLLVVRVVEGEDTAGEDGAPEVVATLDPADPSSLARAAELLSTMDVVILQHEYGIYGPRCGRAVLDLLEGISVPIVTTLHTVLTRPRPTQRVILERLVASSARTVVLTRAARRLLHDRYGLDVSSTVVIPHGTAVRASRINGVVSGGVGPTLLTWGLIGPGKGLEWALAAVRILRDRFPGIRYVIAGRTHPRVLHLEGEAYRRRLVDLIERLDLVGAVEVVDDYLSQEALGELLGAATVVLLPYDSAEQVSSGVLVEAVAAAVPVVATAFPHAVELADTGAVITTPHRSPLHMAKAIAQLLESPTARSRMIMAQRRLGPSLAWSGVAARYEEVVRQVLDSPMAVGA